MKTMIKRFLKYLQRRFPKCYQQYCKVRYPDPWGTLANIDIYVQILWRKLLYLCHVEKCHPAMKRIRALKDSHKGERCFVVGTGSSLRYEDLELIDGEYSFSSNSIFLTYEKTKWRPNCYGIVDYFGYKEDISKYSEANFDNYAKEYIFLHSKIKLNSEQNKNVPLLISTINHQEWRMRKHKYKQEDELSLCFNDCFTVTNMLIAVAIYMGFREIYLLGVDCDYSGARKHIEETLADKIRKQDATYLQPRTDLMFSGYELMKKTAERKQCSIYNATRGGKLEVFPRVTLEEIIGGKQNEQH